MAVIFALGSVATMQSAGAAEIFLGTEGQNTEVTITNQYAQGSQIFGGVNATQAEAQGSPGIYKTAGNVALVIGSLNGDINLDDIVGGGYAKGATATSTVGDAKITVNAGVDHLISSGDLIGGGYAYHYAAYTDQGSAVGAVAKTGKTYIEFNSGKINGLIIGGGSAMGYAAKDFSLDNIGTYLSLAETGDTHIVINGGTVAEAVIGGGKSRLTLELSDRLYAKAITGQTRIDIKGGQVGGVVGGGWAMAGYNTEKNASEMRTAYAEVNDSIINVEGGTVNRLYQTDLGAGVLITNSDFDGAIVGGGVAAYGGTNKEGNKYSEVKSGNVTINVTGGTVKGAVYAGAVSSATERTSGNNNNNGDGGIASVQSATVNITGGVIEGNVYAGGASVALKGDAVYNAVYDAGTTSIQKATIVLGGNAEIQGDIYSGGAIFTIAELDAKKDAFVKGNKVTSAKVVFDSKDVKLTGKVINGSALTVTDNKTPTKSVTKVGGTSTFSLEGSSNFNNGFASSAEAVAYLHEKAGTGVTQFAVNPGESNNGVTVTLKEDGSIDSSVTIDNPKTQKFGQTAVQNIMVWRNAMNDMNKRLGELRDIEGNTGVWARVNAGKHEYKSVDNDFQSLQFGADTKIESLANIRLGAALSYTRNDLSYDGGSGDSDVYSLAGYASWLGETGSFVDVVAKVGRIDSDTSVTGTEGSYDATTYSFSAEIGHRFPVMSYGFIEPQLELNYGYVEDVSFNTDNNGLLTHSKIDSVDSLIGRAGVRAGIVCPQNKGTLYVRASVLREFKGEVSYTRGESSYKEDMGDTWFEFGIGGSYNINANSQIYADLERTSSADLSEPWRVNLGYRYAF